MLVILNLIWGAIFRFLCYKSLLESIEDVFLAGVSPDNILNLFTMLFMFKFYKF
jgi:hypothetical protein